MLGNIATPSSYMRKTILHNPPTLGHIFSMKYFINNLTNKPPFSLQLIVNIAKSNIIAKKVVDLHATRVDNDNFILVALEDANVTNKICVLCPLPT